MFSQTTTYRLKPQALSALKPQSRPEIPNHRSYQPPATTTTMTDPNPNNGSSSNNFMQGHDRRLPPLAPNTSPGTLPPGFGGAWLARGGGEPGSGLHASFNEWFVRDEIEEWRKKQYKQPEGKK